MTSFLPSQKTWGPTREHYPAIIFQYKRLPGLNHPLYKPEEWYHKGRLVLDHSHQPVIHYHDIPDVVSSKFPGYAIEAIQRTDSRITLGDILARMPRSVKTKSPKAKKPSVVLTTNSLTQRTHRFRVQAGCLSWKVRKGSEAMEEFLEKHLSPESKVANSTKDFRDLTKEERDGVEKKKTPKGEKATAAGPSAATEEESTQVEYDMEEADAEGEDDDLAAAPSAPAAPCAAVVPSAAVAPFAAASPFAATDEEYIQVEYGMEEADTEGKDDGLATALSAASTPSAAATPSTSATPFAAAASSVGTEEGYTEVDDDIGEADAEGEDDDFDAARWHVPTTAPSAAVVPSVAAAPSAAVVPSVAGAPSAAIEDGYTQVDSNIGEADAEGVDDDPDAPHYFQDAMGDMDWVSGFDDRNFELLGEGDLRWGTIPPTLAS